MSFSKEVIELFDYIGNKIGITIDWTSRNVIPYLQDLCDRFMKYNICCYSIGTIISLIVIWICIKTWKKSFEEGWFPLNIVFGCAAIPCFIYAIVEIFQCIFIPELQIYEYLQKFL